jgi:outer membrane biosynthesis protein TonB
VRSIAGIESNFRRVRVALVAVVGVLVLGGSGHAAAQPAGECRLFVNGSDARNHSDAGSALEVDADGSLDMIVASPGRPITQVAVDLEFAPVSLSLFDDAVAPAPDWANRFDVAEGARYGVGLYRAVATAQLGSGEICSAPVWFEVTGRSPFTTVVGVIAAVVAASGLGLVIAGILRATRGQGGAVLSLVGGATAGAGALVLAQQSGMVPIEADNVALWTAAPAAASGLVNRAVALVTRRDEEPVPGPPLEGRRPRRLSEGTGEIAPVPMPAPASVPRPAPRPEPEPEVMPAPSAPMPAPAAEPRTAPGREPTPPAARPEPSPRPASAPEPTAPGPAPAPVNASVPSDEYSAAPDDRDEEGIPLGLGILTGRRAADPPRSAYARLDCPDAVVGGAEFELVVGLASTPAPDVVGDPLVRPASSVGPYTLVVQVVAEGFVLRSGESWRVELPVTAAEPYPSTSLHLTALAGPERVKGRTVRAIFSVDGQTMGMAFRSVVVAVSHSILAETPVAPQDSGIDLSIPTTWTAPDVTVRILRGEARGRLLWTFETSRGVDVPTEPISTDIGDDADPRDFAKELIDRVNLREGSPGLFRFLKGVGRTIANELPDAFWDVLRATANKTGGQPPTVLLLSEEPFIPWELAVVEPALDGTRPPFLSAQAVVGRWVLGHKLPPLPPPSEARVDQMAVIVGVYNRPGWSRLIQAEDEAQRLSQSYGAIAVNAAATEVLDCLDGTPKVDLMHFAVHGKYDPNGTQDGVVLTDGHILDPFEVKGSTLARRPFVFLNACQVGVGNRVLGDYAGLAAAFLEAGASGVIAPLWSVNDEVARDIALRFYQRIFSGATIGSVLSEERSAFAESDEHLSATYLAYQFFGHPAMKVSRVGSQVQGGT